MQTMMVEVNTDNALKVLRSLDKKKQIRIVDEASMESPSLPGKPMSLSAFKSWIESAESADTISLKEAKNLWAAKKEATAKKYEVRISINALQNIGEITGYIAFVNQQLLNAIRVGDKIFKVIDNLAINPFAYRECSELPTKTKIYRRALCLSWSIIFKIKQKEIVVLGIIHQSRRSDATRALRKVK